MNTRDLTLSAATPKDGLELAKNLAARFREGTGEGTRSVADGLKAHAPADPSLLTAVAFQTIAAANHYWR